MKTSLLSRNFFTWIINFKQTTECNDLRNFSGRSSLSGLSSEAPLIHARENKMKNNDWKILKSLKLRKLSILLHALAVRVGVVSNSGEVSKAFPRIVFGLFLLVWVAPYSDVFYTNFDVNDKIAPAEVWYYESINWLFLCLGPYLKGVFTSVGYYFCLVHKRSILSYIFIYPTFYDIGKIIWLLQVSNHDEYEMVTPTMYLIYGGATATFLITILNLLSFWLFHRVHAVKASLDGLATIADKAEPKVVVDAFMKTMERNKKVNQFQY